MHHVKSIWFSVASKISPLLLSSAATMLSVWWIEGTSAEIMPVCWQPQIQALYTWNFSTFNQHVLVSTTVYCFLSLLLFAMFCFFSGSNDCKWVWWYEQHKVFALHADFFIFCPGDFVPPGLGGHILIKSMSSVITRQMYFMISIQTIGCLSMSLELAWSNYKFISFSIQNSTTEAKRKETFLVAEHHFAAVAHDPAYFSIFLFSFLKWMS